MSTSPEYVLYYHTCLKWQHMNARFHLQDSLSCLNVESVTRVNQTLKPTD